MKQDNEQGNSIIPLKNLRLEDLPIAAMQELIRLLREYALAERQSNTNRCNEISCQINEILKQHLPDEILKLSPLNGEPIMRLSTLSMALLEYARVEARGGQPRNFLDMLLSDLEGSSFQLPESTENRWNLIESERNPPSSTH